MDVNVIKITLKGKSEDEVSEQEINLKELLQCKKNPCDACFNGKRKGVLFAFIFYIFHFLYE